MFKHFLKLCCLSECNFFNQNWVDTLMRRYKPGEINMSCGTLVMGPIITLFISAAFTIIFSVVRCFPYCKNGGTCVGDDVCACGNDGASGFTSPYCDDGKWIISHKNTSMRACELNCVFPQTNVYIKWTLRYSNMPVEPWKYHPAGWHMWSKFVAHRISSVVSTLPFDFNLNGCCMPGLSCGYYIIYYYILYSKH